ncbi:hypothetical protein [Halobacterium wangiae]|uniref:hypothetical protein n=1 Tax=Halobacterium wangiae TaxID=2902623 RepID=UPI001E3EBCA9|nr:hypothetical protein [Halobacterium wangiae]
MVPTTRRRLLASAAALTAVLAGCIEGSTTDTESIETTTTTKEVETTTITDETVSVAAGEYETWEFSGPGSVEYEFSVADGPAVDSYVLSSQNFEYFQDGETFQTEAESEDSSDGDGMAVLGSGDFVVLVDNTDAGAASPPDDGATAQVEVEATVTR